MKIITILVLASLLAGCAPLLIGGVVGYEVGKHPHRSPHIDWR